MDRSFTVGPLAVLALVLALALGAAGQELRTQTLPRGFDAVDGNFSTSHPFTTTQDSIWQWHYAAAEFDAPGPLQITEMWVRASHPTLAVDPFAYVGLEIRLIETATDYQPGSHLPVFENNEIRAEIVRSGVFVGGEIDAATGPVAHWIRLGLTRPFTYDPSLGRDLIVQLRTCGPLTPFTATIDGRTGSPGTVGGNRYGHVGSCTATTQSTASVESVPIVRIAYREVLSQTLPAGFENVMGNSSTHAPFNQTTQQKWQWHYDSGQFAASGPIAITDVSIRPDSPSATLGPFDFEDVEVFLAEAASNYVAGNHPVNFSANIQRSRRCRVLGPFMGSAHPTGGTVSNWFSLQLARPFIYDPSSGNDLIIQIRKCGATTTALGAAIDAVAGPTNTVGGNRYGNPTDCLSDTITSFQFSDFVPVVKIDWVPAVEDLPHVETFDLAGLAGPVAWEQDTGTGVGLWDFFDSDEIDPLSPNPGTRPSADHTTGRPHDGFFATSNDVFESPFVQMKSPWFDLAGATDPWFSFWFHSAAMTTMTNEVEITIESTTASDSIVVLGDVGVAAWTFFYHPVPPAFLGQRVRVVFATATDNGTDGHEIAIDDFRLFDLVQEGGQLSTPTALLDVNEALQTNGFPVGLAFAGPYYADAVAGGTFDLRVAGPPNRAIILLGGSLTPGAQSLGTVGILDLTNVVILANGTQLDFVSSIFRTGPTGALVLALPVAATLPIGTVFNLQALVFTGGPEVVRLTNSVSVEVGN